jgi:hypothetical protein
LRTVIYANCAVSGDVSEDCRHGIAQATLALTETIFDAAKTGVVGRQLVIKLPYTNANLEAIGLIIQIEQAAISVVQTRLNQDIRRLEPFRREVPPAVAQLAVARDVIEVRQIHEQALKDANSGSNWIENPKSTFTFRSTAYQQARAINAGHNWD